MSTTYIYGHVMSAFLDVLMTYGIWCPALAPILLTCPYCRLLLTTDRELCDHIRTQHADMRYSCQQCPCTFVSMGGLNRHVRNIHQKLVKFRCQTCGKGYEGRRNYHDHMATHAGVKRNVCMICQAQFTFKRGLKVHVMRFHPDAIESLSHS